MDDIRTVVKELRRIADAGERIAKALEKQNKTPAFSPALNFCGEPVEHALHKPTDYAEEWAKEALQSYTNEET